MSAAADVLPPLAAADALAAEGRHLEAIALLTDANRERRDAEIEARLVALRHDAFDGLERTAPADLLPPVTAAPPSGRPLAPIAPADLDLAAVRAGLAEHGCLWIRGLVAPAKAGELAGGIDRAIAAFDATEAGAPLREAAPWYVPFKPNAPHYKVTGRRNWVRPSGAVLTADSPRMLFELLEVVRETGVGDLVAAHLGERPALSVNKCTLRRVPVDANTNWHQDGAFLGTEIRTLNLWLALSHCGVDAPGLDILPRRLDDVLPTGTPGALFDWSVSPDIVAELAEETPVVTPTFEPGDALLFDHLLLHRTSVGPDMRRERHAIETWFFAPSAYPEGGIPVVC